jgi:serine/threonine protein kinase
VKTENMLLDKTRTVKIADFGVARLEASNPSDMTGETGTLGYMAPEVPFPGQSHSSAPTHPPPPQLLFCFVMS